MKHVEKNVIIMIFVFLLFFVLPDYSNAYNLKTQKNILILHSYNEEQDWTRGLTAGLVETIREANDNYFISVEYMDWKNYPSEDNLEYLYQYYNEKYAEKHLDVVIACDDVALSFALKNSAALFSDAPIVFCGVNQASLSKIRNGYDNFTGVIEVADPTETLKMAYLINPSMEKIYLVSDNTESGISTAKLFTDKIKALEEDFEIVPLNNLEFNELLDVLSKLDNRSIVLYATYNSDVKGNILEYNIALKEMCESSTAPLYHQYDFGLSNGAFGGNLISPKLYGEYTAAMAVRIIKGEKADDIPIYTSDAARRVVDYNQLERFGIQLDSIPEGVELVNRPFSFFKTYKSLVLIVLLVFALLINMIIMLWIYNKRVRKMKQELALKNEDLMRINEELVSSDRTLKTQYEEICAMEADLRSSEEKYTYLALHDVLTGLPNRRSLFQDASHSLEQSSAHLSALIYIDMDNFKYINDTMGHGFGDEFIKKVSERLLRCMTDDSTLYRLGGDEFIILLAGVQKQSEVESFINKIMRIFKKEFMVHNSTLKISASIGVALYPEHGRNIHELIKSADIAMFKAKESGKNRFTTYESKMNQDFSDRMTLEKYLHSGMKKNEFEIYYQPQVDTFSGQITGMEALLRWKSPELGTVPPLKFIPVAEVTRLIIPLGEWVLWQACGFLSELHKNGYPDMTISVNISIIQILEADFCEKIIKILEHFKLEPEYLELEITETILIESFDTVLNKLKRLYEYGIGIALDDFGKGYSSLNYIMHLPISTLKIDKSFVDNIFVDAEYNEITCHIINMGKSLGMSIVAEGVENKEQLEYLKKYKCDKIQGYLFSKPLSKADIITLLG